MQTWYKLNSSMLHTHYILKRLLPTKKTAYSKDKLHGRYITEYREERSHGIFHIWRYKRNNTREIISPLNIVQHILIDFLFIIMLELNNNYRIFLFKTMHALSFKCFVIHYSGLSVFVIILLRIWSRTLHYFIRKRSKLSTFS